MEQREPIPTLKILTCRKYSFENLTEFSQEKNVLDTAASKIDGFLGEIKMVFYSPEWTYLEERNHISNLKNLCFRNYSFQNSTQFHREAISYLILLLKLMALF
jgi:hypothetical protein